MSIFRKEVGTKASSHFFDFTCLYLMFLCYMPSSQKWEVCSQHSLSCFWFFYSSFSWIWQDALSVCCLLCLSCLAALCYLGVSCTTTRIFAPSMIRLLTYLCKTSFFVSGHVFFFFVGYTLLILYLWSKHQEEQRLKWCDGGWFRSPVHEAWGNSLKWLGHVVIWMLMLKSSCVCIRDRWKSILFLSG